MTIAPFRDISWGQMMRAPEQVRERMLHAPRAFDAAPLGVLANRPPDLLDSPDE